MNKIEKLEQEIRETKKLFKIANNPKRIKQLQDKYDKLMFKLGFALNEDKK